MTTEPGARLFDRPGMTAREVVAGDLPDLQRFLEENPAYFIAVSATGPHASAAQEEFHDRPPADWAWDGKWMIRVDDATRRWIAVADVVRNLLAPGVWHIGLFIVATSLHGTGEAARIYGALEDWIREGGARWLRLNVAAGNGRAGRFWEKAGYREVRRREGVVVGRQANTMRVMVKSLAGDALDEYLGLVARDRPGAP